MGYFCHLCGEYIEEQPDEDKICPDCFDVFMGDDFNNVLIEKGDE